MNRYPLPTSRQEEWADMEMGVIIHHCMETYHPEIPEDQWKKAGSLMPAESFAPTDENTDQWIGTAAKMGAKYAVLVANHCSGFSLWPTKGNDYSMAKSPYRNGQADVVKDFVESCKKYGVRPGLYYSTGCNTHCGINDDEEIDYRSAHYQQYVGMVTRQLTELWSQYGEMFEIWFDGGVVPLEMGGPDILGLLRKYQPNAICFQGPSGHPTNLRWVGNENGCAPIDCWSTAGTGSTGFADTSVDETGIGRPDGAYWIPAETDMASRKQSALGGGWFWQAGEDHLVYTAEDLMDTYLTSVGRNSNLLLGMCIDQRGHFPEEDERQFLRFGELVRDLYRDPAVSVRGTGMRFELKLQQPESIRNLVIAEDIHYGQRVRRFHVEIDAGEGWQPLFEARSIGHKRIVPVNRTICGARLVIDEAVDAPILREVTLYR